MCMQIPRESAAAGRGKAESLTKDEAKADKKWAANNSFKNKEHGQGSEGRGSVIKFVLFMMKFIGMVFAAMWFLGYRVPFGQPLGLVFITWPILVSVFRAIDQYIKRVVYFATRYVIVALVGIFVHRCFDVGILESFMLSVSITTVLSLNEVV